MSWAIDLAERRVLPDPLVRVGMRRLLSRRLSQHLEVVDQWRVSGMHYSLTLEAWLEAMDRSRAELLPLFGATYGTEARRWFARWRMFFMACSELFRYRGGSEWFVAHTLMRPRAGSQAG